MQVEWFECFLETARQKSLSKASEKLNMTQPALSKIIRNLEKGIGTTLFIRSSAGMVLTEAGSLVYERLQPIVTDLHSLITEAQGFNIQQKISIGTLPSLAMNYVPHKMVLLKANSIEVELVVRTTSNEVLELLHLGTIHAAVTEQQPPQRHFWQKNLLQEPYFAVFPESHPMSGQTCVTIADIAKERLVLYPNGCDVRKAVFLEYEKSGAAPQVSIEVPFGDSILGVVKAGAGISVVPEMIAKRADSFALKPVPISDFDSFRIISLITRSEQMGKLLYRYLREE